MLIQSDESALLVRCGVEHQQYNNNNNGGIHIHSYSPKSIYESMYECLHLYYVYCIYHIAGPSWALMGIHGQSQSSCTHITHSKWCILCTDKPNAASDDIWSVCARRVYMTPNKRCRTFTKNRWPATYNTHTLQCSQFETYTVQMDSTILYS